MVDKCIDYAAESPVAAFGKGSVAFVFDTTGLAVEYMPLVRRGALVLSIARVPPGSAMAAPEAGAAATWACGTEADAPWTAFMGRKAMDLADAGVRLWARNRYGIQYEHVKTEPTSADLEELGELVRAGKLRAVVGRAADLENREEVRKGCMDVYRGKGGLGKFVIAVDEKGRMAAGD